MPGAFERYFGLGRGEFERLFSKKSNAGGVAGGGGGRVLKLRFDRYKMAWIRFLFWLKCLKSV